VERFDTVYVLDNGQIAEFGRPRDLMAADGIYARMRNKQSGFVMPVGDRSAQVEPERLASVPILGQLSVAAREEIAPLFATEWFPEGRVIVHEGDPGDKFYLIVRGKVEVFRESSLAVLDDGDYFGEIALLESTPRTASVKTLAPSVFLVLHRGHFLELMSRFPEMREGIRHVAETRRIPQK